MKFILIILSLTLSFDAISGGVVVVHPSNTSEVSLSDIKKFFLGKKQAFRNGNSALLATLEEGNSIRKVFNTNILNKNESIYVGYWAKLSFTGQAIPPLELADSESMKVFIANNPNAIGIMDEALVDESVRVVRKL